MVIRGERKRQLVGALCAAFEIGELRQIVELVDSELADAVSWTAAKRTVVESMFDQARRRGGDRMVEAMVRSARRERRDNLELAAVVLACCPYAPGIGAAAVDRLTAALLADGVALDEVEQVARRNGHRLPSLRSSREAEALGDLVERLAGHAAAPRAVLPILQIATGLRSAGRGALAVWLIEACPAEPAPAVDAAPGGRTRMLIVLYPEDNDELSAELFLSDAHGLPRQVAVLDRTRLAEIPARIHEHTRPGTQLYEAMRQREIAQIDIVLPMRNLLAAVDEWVLWGLALSIGETYPVVVRCLERNVARQWPEFLLARQLAGAMWRELHLQRERCAVHWIEAADQLGPHEIRHALRQHAVRRWLVAAMCADAPAGVRLGALELMIRQGVPAALAVRGDAATSTRALLEPVCAQPFRLPHGVHEHRTAEPRVPVTLLWDDPDFRPEEWR